MKKPLIADYKTWAGQNTFYFNAKLVSGPRKHVFPSLIVHTIMLSLTINWSAICLPFLKREKESQTDFAAEPSAGTKTIDFALLALSVLT